MALELADEYKDIAQRLIDKYPENFGNFDINQMLFLKENSKSPKKYAEIKKVTAPYTFMTSIKFIITVYEPCVCAMNDAQIHLLIMHELMHIDEDFNKLKKHDLEDFKVLIAKYGAAWDIDPNLEDILDEEDEIQNNTSNESDDEVEIL
jgi:hypothetical protein